MRNLLLTVMSQDKPSPVKSWMLLLAPIIGVLAGIIAYKNGMEEVAAKTLAIALCHALCLLRNVRGRGSVRSS